jgi:hypothetical protein
MAPFIAILSKLVAIFIDWLGYGFELFAQINFLNFKGLNCLCC